MRAPLRPREITASINPTDTTVLDNEDGRICENLFHPGMTVENPVTSPESECTSCAAQVGIQTYKSRRRET